MNQALDTVKRELGPEAVILHTRQFKRGGVLGVGAKTVVEVTAATDINVAPRKRKAQPSAKPQAAGPTTPALHLLAKAYGRQAPAQAPEAGPAAVVNTPDPQLAEELKQIKQLVRQVVNTTRDQATPAMPDNLVDHYVQLIEAELAEELAQEVVDSVSTEAKPSDEDAMRQAIADEIAKLVAVDDRDLVESRPDDGRPRTIALIGPTGVGKTTTIAKLAATFKLKQRLNVALITIDTYRIAAVDQLRTYADIIGLPLHIVNSPMQMAGAIERCHGYDVVLIDTAGRSPKDAEKLDQLRAFIDAARPHEVHLVLSSTASESVLIEAADRFGAIRTDRVIFTKMDEAVNFGVVLNVIRRVNKKLSYITTGQEVPHDIERGEPRRLAELILGKGLS